MAYDTDRLYEDAFTNTFKWEKWLPPDVFRYHDLIYKEVNAPVSLQMGCLLPFISSLCGPKTRGKFLTRDSVLNLFWINIGVSGIGKTQSRNRMISEPMQFLLQHVDHSLTDFEVSLYTRAGIYIFRNNVYLNYFFLYIIYGIYIWNICNKYIDFNVHLKVSQTK